MTLLVEAAACVGVAGAALAPIDGAAVEIAAATPVASAAALPMHCHVTGAVATSIAFSLRVPREWNGKLLMQGCRAMCGYHATADSDDALRRGYATLTTDTGHTGSPIDVRWAQGNRMAQVDYAWRAVHLVARVGKSILSQLTGRAPTRSYHRGCSNGGRQGLLEAERQPDTFDGIIAGAPLVPGDGLLHLLWSARANLDEDGRPLLTRNDLDTLHGIVVRQCGDRAGVVQHPEQCRIDAHAAEFGRGTPAEHWTSAQREAIRRIYAGPHDAAGRPLTAGGPAPGSERAWTSFVAPPGEASLFETLASDYLRYLVYDGKAGVPGFLEFDFTRDAPAVRASAHESRASGDLRAFAARGGRVIVWHGWADESVVPWNSIKYAHAARDALGTGTWNATFRIYLQPAVGHCTDTVGPGGVDWLTLLEEWVERGRAPPGGTTF